MVVFCMMAENDQQRETLSTNLPNGYQQADQSEKVPLVGHTLRKSKEEICYKALLWNLQGRRRVGAPKRTWRNSIKRECSDLSNLANVDKNKEGSSETELGSCL
jgi:hypothetical protein